MAFKLPKIQLGPKPGKRDLSALAVLLPVVVSAAISRRTARAQPPGLPCSTSSISTVALAQPGICTLSLPLLDQAATRGTLWGNLAALGGIFAGLSGVLLAAARVAA